MNVGSILGGAFSLIRERPGAMAVWGLIYLATEVVLGLGTSSLLGSGINMVGTWSLILLLNFALFLVVMVLYTAIQRAVLRPGDGGFASLRLGMDEVRAILLMIFYVVLFYIGLIFLGVVMVLFVGATANTGSVATMWFMLVIQLIGLFCLLAWFYVKLSLSFPLTLLRRRFVMGEAWTLSMGRFWTLFGAYFVIFVIVFVLSLVIGLLTQQEYFSAVLQGGFNSESAQQEVLSPICPADLRRHRRDDDARLGAERRARARSA